jgi:hypothetical protein
VENGGMNGSFVDENTPAFWAGGDFFKALATAAKYLTGTTTPEGEIPFVVTHGGKIILNDAVMRGEVVASRGKIGAIKITQDGLEIDTEKILGKILITENGIIMDGANAHASLGECNSCAFMAAGRGGYGFCPDEDLKVSIASCAAEDGLAFMSPSGMFGGLRTKTRVISSLEGNYLSTIDSAVLIQASSGTCQIRVDEMDGQEYEIISLGAALSVSGDMLFNGTFFNMSTGQESSAYTCPEGRRKIRMKYFAAISQWVVTEEFAL